MQEVSNRKKLIRPVTLMKVRQFIHAVGMKVVEKQECQLDKLAREHSISGSNATALVRLGLVKPTDVKHFYVLGEEYGTDDHTVKLVIEDVRKHNLKSNGYEVTGKKPEIPIRLDGNSPSLNDPGKDDPMVSQLNEGLKSKQIGSMLERAFRQVAQSTQTSIFDSQINNHRDLVQIASAISTGVYCNIGINTQRIDAYTDERLAEINELVARAAKDLLSKLKS